MSRPALTALLIVIAVGAMMLLETALSRHNERALRARGAIDAEGDVYGWMLVTYPVGFLLIALEGAMRPWLSRDLLLWGVAVFTLAKGLKYWAIATLGTRWSFRVLVLPGVPLVASGPYRLLRHPNYVAVVGEFIGVALMLSAPVSGTMVTFGFAWLMWRRVRVEDRALGRTERA